MKIKIKGFPDLQGKQIRKDNPHFGPVIRVIEKRPYSSKEFDFNYLIVVGARNSESYDNRKIDAWASYLYSPSKGKWVLGAN